MGHALLRWQEEQGRGRHLPHYGGRLHAHVLQARLRVGRHVGDPLDPRPLGHAPRGQGPEQRALQGWRDRGAHGQAERARRLRAKAGFCSLGRGHVLLGGWQAAHGRDDRGRRLLEAGLGRRTAQGVGVREVDLPVDALQCGDGCGPLVVHALFRGQPSRDGGPRAPLAEPPLAMPPLGRDFRHHRGQLVSRARPPRPRPDPPPGLALQELDPRARHGGGRDQHL
mmetsp:Transcript_41712/g.129796  ORF Transcript_41712/g.129796 Transcript_41712/m.129796 type:complete len:225 (-) Transcript_41712:757-1431(-)